MTSVSNTSRNDEGVDQGCKTGIWKFDVRVIIGEGIHRTLIMVQPYSLMRREHQALLRQLTRARQILLS